MPPGPSNSHAAIWAMTRIEGTLWPRSTVDSMLSLTRIAQPGLPAMADAGDEVPSAAVRWLAPDTMPSVAVF